MDAGGRLVTLAEVKEILEREQSERGELNYEQKLALEHARAFARLSAEKANELLAKLQEVKKVSAAHAIKIVDTMPTNADDVRAIFAKERFQLEKEEIDKVLELVLAYAG
ncbi:MAG TPA: RNA polymerase Rpb4 family protein [Candidatus Thermoplasmatota archaeon]|nr:RNA polymerase Rpb4 family protein [Candidatus Thermoplasmatota archaeon]